MDQVNAEQNIGDEVVDRETGQGRTPGPWKAERLYDGGRTICSMRSPHQLLCINAPSDNLRPYDATEPNAHMIVKAVNNHDPLVAALQSARALICDLMEDFSDIDVLQQIEAALSAIAEKGSE